MQVTTVTTAEAAELAERAPRTIRRLHERGILPAIQLTPRGHLRFRRDDIERLLEPRRGAA